jgi:hypothetical protein
MGAAVPGAARIRRWGKRGGGGRPSGGCREGKPPGGGCRVEDPLAAGRKTET